LRCAPHGVESESEEKRGGWRNEMANGGVAKYENISVEEYQRWIIFQRK
jgi:hypothetical protein